MIEAMCVDVSLSWGSSLNLPEIPECALSLAVSWKGGGVRSPQSGFAGQCVGGTM